MNIFAVQYLKNIVDVLFLNITLKFNCCHTHSNDVDQSIFNAKLT